MGKEEQFDNYGLGTRKVCTDYELTIKEREIERILKEVARKQRQQRN